MSASRLLTLSAAVVALSVLVASCRTTDAGPTGQNPPPAPPPPGAPPPAPPPPPSAPGVTLYAAGNISECQPADNDDATAALIMRDTEPYKVMVLGDMTSHGYSTEFESCYNPTWGQFKDRSYPVLGNHEYDWYELDATKPAGADTVRKALGAFGYWGTQQLNSGCPTWAPRCGYYAFDYGNWRIVVINDNWNRCSAGQPGGRDNCAEHVFAGPSSEYFVWLAQQFMAAKAANKCTLAAFHSARWFSSTTPGFIHRDQRRTLWNVLDSTGVDVILNGQEHNYERMAPMRVDGMGGVPDEVRGIQAFNVGAGGGSVNSEASVVAIHPESKARSFKFGVLKLSLKDTGYTWEYLPDDGTPAVDAGSGTCHN